jgi:uncharacterized membrane protein
VSLFDADRNNGFTVPNRVIRGPFYFPVLTVVHTYIQFIYPVVQYVYSFRPPPRCGGGGRGGGGGVGGGWGGGWGGGSGGGAREERGVLE